MSKEEVLENFLSGDARKVLNACHAVIHSVVTDREMIESLVPHLSRIKEATKQLNYGGGFAPNQRFVDKALKVIDNSRREKCLCEYSFDKYGQRAEFFVQRGFVLLWEKTEGFVNTGEIECSRCHQRYIVEEEFTGWHMTSTRYKKV